MKMHHDEFSFTVANGAIALVPRNSYAMERAGLFPVKTALVDSFEIRQLAKTALIAILVLTNIAIVGPLAVSALDTGVSALHVFDNLNAPHSAGVSN